MAGNKDQELARVVSPNMLAVYGLATILGAGIYVVIGEIAGEAGYLAPLSFLIAAIAAGFSALSYAELGARFPHSGGSAVYIDVAFGYRWLTWITAWAVIAAGLVSAATIATGFAGYLTAFLPIPKEVSIPVLLIALTTIAAIGIKESVWFMLLCTGAGLLGLTIVLIVGGPNIVDYPSLVAQGFGSSEGWAMGVLIGSFLAFYAFIGFEDLVTLGEEVQDVQRSLPRAILIALAISLFFYVSIALVVVSTLSPEELAATGAPLVEVVRASGYSGDFLAVLGLLVIVDGALAQIVMASRVVHDLGKRRGGAPAWMAAINSRTQTPLVATLLAGAVVLLLALFFPTGALAGATSFITLCVFIAINAALLRLKLTGRAGGDGIVSYPLLVPVSGLVLSVVLLAAQIFAAS
ncbi:APC family permease [Alterisphingorhabdus coralli]|uniref:Amino acid permease n=1 Tax=Alterisphingorhabdus coralli TaxID=3071408 RepID=A0AA97F661_9SPHN|nr:amino acid permease [Parasphingorhabdus sp. SCSIO 66989]WOE74018.1 amino acid permease [Parasphingorhabdus sp. SCSIO 66989]